MPLSFVQPSVGTKLPRRATSVQSTRWVWAVMSAMLLLAGSNSYAADNAMKSLVIVEGASGRGSGFIVTMEGKKYLVTNLHVIMGNTALKFKNLDNEEILTGPVEVAGKADLVRLAVASLNPSLNLPAPSENLGIGEAITVAGNAEGSGVVREIKGKIKGVGPDRIEVDAAFVPGNSGSPILLKSTGSVIGVATYLVMPESRQGKKGKKGEQKILSLNEVRRFGYRVDKVASWMPTDAERFARETSKLTNIQNVTSTALLMLQAPHNNLFKGGSLQFVSRSAAAGNPDLGTLAAAADACAAQYRPKMSALSRKTALVDFYGKVRSVLTNDVRGLKTKNFTGYCGDMFDEQMAMRKEMLEFVDAELKVLAAS